MACPSRTDPVDPGSVLIGPSYPLPVCPATHGSRRRWTWKLSSRRRRRGPETGLSKCSPFPFSRAFPRNEPPKCSRVHVFRTFPCQTLENQRFCKEACPARTFGFPRNARCSRSSDHFRAIEMIADPEVPDHLPGMPLTAESAILMSADSLSSDLLTTSQDAVILLIHGSSSPGSRPSWLPARLPPAPRRIHQ